MKRTLCSVLLSLFLLAACGEQNGSPASGPVSTPVPVPAEFAGNENPFGPEAAAAGAEIFRTNCETCHGPQGHGDGPAGQSLSPKPQDLSELQKIAGDDYLFWRIYDGKPGTSMVAWKGILTDEEIWQVVSFIRTLE
ncbi:MAG TPA: cytochrome c [Anaerolineales bacterium]|nr:cytochrome c [Anaerolineales bacterium]